VSLSLSQLHQSYVPNKFVRWEHRWIYPFVLKNPQEHIDLDFKGIRSLELTEMEEKEALQATEMKASHQEMSECSVCPALSSVLTLSTGPLWSAP
jgi:hypothetical protein